MGLQVIDYIEGYVVLPRSDFKTAQAVTKDAFVMDDFALIPHTISNARRLYSLGYEGVRTPMGEDYSFKYLRHGKLHPPMGHQKATAEFAVMRRSCFILSDPGTGKTASVLWAWHYLRQRGMAKKLLVVCPRSIIHAAWYSDIMATMPQIKVGVVRGTPAQRAAVLRSNADILIINHDGISHTPQIFKVKDISHVAVDEASAFSSHKSRRSLGLRKLVGNKVVWVMTATPATRAPDRVWALCQLVDPTKVPKFFTHWRDQTMVKNGLYGYRPRKGKEVEALVFNAMQPAIRFNKQDCQDLPGTVILDRVVPPSAEQQAFIKAMLKDWIVEDAKDKAPITAVNAGVRGFKILQAMAGVVKRDDGAYHYLPCDARVQEVLDIVDDTDVKVFILAPYIGVIEALARALRNHLGSAAAVEVIRGSVGDTERARIVNAFQDPNNTTLKVIVAHPETASHGLTLTAADTIIWYAPFHKAEYWIQANERTDRPGQTRKTTIYAIHGGGAEKAVYDAIRDQVGTQAVLLNLYAAATKGNIYDPTT